LALRAWGERLGMNIIGADARETLANA